MSKNTKQENKKKPGQKAKRCQCGKSRFPAFGEPVGQIVCCYRCKSKTMISLITNKPTPSKQCLCGKNSYYGYEGGKPTRCSDCMEPNMKSLKKSHNPTQPCTCGKYKVALFGYPGQTATGCIFCQEEGMCQIRGGKTRLPKVCKCKKGKAEYGFRDKVAECCKICIQPGMISFMFGRCKCKKGRATYGLPGQSNPQCCRLCSTESMIDVYAPRCGCKENRQPTYGFPGGKRVACSSCAQNGMILLSKKWCKCGKADASFGFENGERLCCSMCREPKMILLSECLCSCGTVANFGLPGSKPECCKQCAVNSDKPMINLKKTPKCQGCGEVTPSYGVPGEPPTHCANCKTDNHQNLRRPSCLAPSCDRFAYYGYKDNEPCYCSNHKKQEMINVTAIYCFCGKTAIFGEPCLKPKKTHCRDHRSETMLYLGGGPPCVCKKEMASLSLPGSKPTHCGQCRSIQMVYTGYRTCSKCQSKGQYQNGLCTDCDPDYIPSKIGASKVSCEWIDRLEQELGRPIQHTHYDPELLGGIKHDEFRTPCLPRHPVDGYDSETETIYEFLGDIWHGHPSLFGKQTNYKGQKYTELFEKTQEKFKVLLQNGYRILYVWECDYRKSKALQTLHQQCREFQGTLDWGPI